ncbi:DNA-packaging protein [Bradyrhizobium sp. JYMT SZCCT0428]|uniref:DNA-packaging protein n=1 Tax=Bradyrhizobium sp. JYMT SZCCT0428 TaxID=2807673 RepID=UPI001BA7FE7F|nr:terminase family protein [Bradyrhizobium sp. JYMT SZCCT0428]MBR1156865.1 DNA-packaging protein [Bradyrhizobium sp. JYMT SZCCT0428]
MQTNSIYGQLASALQDNWRMKARASQLPPTGDNWNGWLVLAGRGFGKTRTGAEWVRELVETGAAGRIALVAPTAGDARDVQIEGPAGILAVSSSWFRPVYEPSKRRLTWPNGATASTFSSEESDRLRGPQHDAAWADEIAAMHDPSAVWDMLMFGLRIGKRPRWLATTTPKPIKLLRELLAREGNDVVVTRGSTFDNAANLAPAFLQTIRVRYEGTRLGRQELNAELLLDIPGSLWSRDMLERANGSWRVPEMKRTVVAIDPSGTRGQDDGGDSVGIVVAGLGVDGFGYVLADRTCKLSPDGWARTAVTAYHAFKADRIVAERNFGGAMVEHVIRTVDPNVAYREVTASRGKVARAEPVAALYEQGRVRHLGTFTDLEDQMAALTGDGFMGDGSPDRCDALVWALSELMVGHAVPEIDLGSFCVVDCEGMRYGLTDFSTGTIRTLP